MNATHSHAHPIPRATAALTRKDAPVTSLPRNLARAFLLTVLTGFLTLLAAAAVAYAGSDPDARILPLGLGATCLTAFCAGVFAIRLQRSDLLLCGVLSGGLWSALLLLLSLLLPGLENAEPLSLGTQITLRCALPLFSIAGAYLTRPRPKKPHRFRRR